MERFTEIYIESDPLNWIAVGWDNFENVEKRLPVDYSDLIDFVADRYFEGDKEVASSYVGSWDWLTMKDEIVLLFKEKMGADGKHKVDSGKVGDKKDGKGL